MLDAILEPLQQGITQRALLELLILGVVCGPLGVWVVLYRQSYAAESIAHAMLPGLVIAALISAPLGLGAAAGLMVAAAGIAVASRQSAVSPDVAVAVTVTTLFGAGTLLALSPAVPLRLGELLFGDPLSVSNGDLIGSACLAAVGLLAMACGHRPLTLSGFDPATARNLGGSDRLVAWLLIGLLALTVLIAVQALGNLLVVAIVVAPAAAALRLCSRLASALVFAAAAAALAGIAGVYVSYYAEIAAGASVALCAIAIFVIALIAGRPTPRRMRRPPPVRSASTAGGRAWASSDTPPPGRVAGEVSMRLEGVEPPRPCEHGDLNAARLPVPPQPRDW